MSANIVIENITDRDIDEIIEIGLTTPELQMRADDPAYYSSKRLKKFIQSPHDIYLVAKIDGKIAGYRLATFNPYLKEAYLVDLVVKPQYRQMGVASKLYEKTFQILQEKNCFWAWTLVKRGNTKNAAILKKRGFKAGNQFRIYIKNAPF